MHHITMGLAAAGAGLLLAASPARSQAPSPAPQPAAPHPVPPPPAATQPAPAQPAAAQPSKDTLSLFFDNDSAAIRPQDVAVLDQAARLYRAGQPIVMILTASADPTGSAIGNIQLSQRRASAVLRGLVARGIPAERFQILAKGENDPPVPAKPGQAEPRDRTVVIAWR